MKIYGKGTAGEAWQYTGDPESMPSWVKSSQRHHIEVEKNGTVRYRGHWRGSYSVVVDKGDWFVLSYEGTVLLYSDEVFKSNFAFSDPARREIESVASEKYRSKPKTVHAWQYTGELHFSELPGWVINLIVHHKLGYHSAFNPVTNADTELFELYYEDVWVPIIKSDWLIRYGEDSFGIVSDDDFKNSFEEIK